VKNMQEVDHEEDAMKKRLNKAIAKDVTGYEPEETEETEEGEVEETGPGSEVKAAIKAAYAGGMSADELHQMVSECAKGKAS
jgi:hypothetical protein